MALYAQEKGKPETRIMIAGGGDGGGGLPVEQVQQMIQTALQEFVQSAKVRTISVVTQSEYDSGPKSEDVLYIIKEG